jgi:translation elongation factor EF-Tu-like GTPase
MEQDIDDMIHDQEENEKGPAPKPKEDIPFMDLTPSESEVAEDIKQEEDSEVEEEIIPNERYSPMQEKILIGKIDKFFNKINVAAIQLTGNIKIGDTIEIKSDGNSTKITVTEMQINRKNVQSASSGDDIGIKVNVPLKEGSEVYLIK